MPDAAPNATLAEAFNAYYRQLSVTLADKNSTVTLKLFSASTETLASLLTNSGFPVDAASLKDIPDVRFDITESMDAAAHGGIIRLLFDGASLISTEEYGPAELVKAILAPAMQKTYEGSNFYAMHDIVSRALNSPAFCRAITAVADDVFTPAIAPYIRALSRYAVAWFAKEKADDLERLKGYITKKTMTALSHITLIGKAQVLPDENGRLVSVTEKYGIHEHNYFRAGVFYDTTLGLKAFDFKGITHYYHPSRFPVMFDTAVRTFRDRVEKEVRAHFQSDAYASPADIPKSVSIDASGMSPFLAALCGEKVRLENEKETREKLAHVPAIDGIISASKGKFSYDTGSGELIARGAMKEGEFKEFAKHYPRSDDKEIVHRLYQRSQPSLSAGDIDKLIDMNMEDIRLEVISERWPLAEADTERLSMEIKLAASLEKLALAGRKIGYFFRDSILKAADERILPVLFMPVTRDGALYAFRPEMKAKMIRSLSLDERKKEMFLQWYFAFVREERLSSREQKRRFALPFGTAKENTPARSADTLRMELGKMLYRRYLSLTPRKNAPLRTKAAEPAPPINIKDAAALLSFSDAEADALISGDMKAALVESSKKWKASVAMAPEAVLAAVRTHFPATQQWDAAKTANAMKELARTLGQPMKIAAFDRFVRIAILMQMTSGGKAAAANAKAN